MAKRDYMELYFQDMEYVNETHYWTITKDDQYYYKTLSEQNYAALDGRIQKNLEFMMKPDNQVTGVNPVVDIYYLDNMFLAYRTKIVEGFDIKQLELTWGHDLLLWENFFISLIQIINDSTPLTYVFPDLFTKGNMLYDQTEKILTLIDNDGIQTQNRFPYVFDSIAEKVMDHRNHSNVFQKYYKQDRGYFTSEYNVLSFYSWFFDYFLGFDLPKFLNFSKEDMELSLKQKNISPHSWLWEAIMNFLSFDSSSKLDPSLFQHLCQNYKTDYDDRGRILVPR